MPLTDIERKIAKLVADNFYQRRESTSHENLLRASKNPTVITKLTTFRIISALSNTPRPSYVPLPLAFQYCGDASLLLEARGSVEIVVGRMKKLFEKDFDSYKDHHPKALVSKKHPTDSEQELKIIALGLFLAKDIPNIFSGLQLNDTHTGFISFRISEHILTQEPRSVWDEYIRTNTPAELIPKPQSPRPKPAQLLSQKPTQQWPPRGWKIVGSLGEGGQGWTFKVRRKSGPDHNFYVLKRLKNKERLRRFQSEIAALTKLQHRGILRIIENGENLEQSFFISEYCEGPDLGKADLSQKDLLTKLHIFRQVCDAVLAAHNAGILHRDLKPSNIFLRSDNSVVVGDFGLCIDLNDAKERATQTLEGVGAERYIAPEVAKGRVPEPHPTSDLYSLGKVLYFILSTKTLLREEYAVGDDDLRTRDAEPGIHFAYEIFDRTIKERPEDRFQNAADLLYALDTVIDRIRLNAHVLLPNMRQRCLFCIVGEYRPNTDLAHELKYTCTNCGNVQAFIAKPSGSWWGRH